MIYLDLFLLYFFVLFVCAAFSVSFLSSISFGWIGCVLGLFVEMVSYFIVSFYRFENYMPFLFFIFTLEM